VPFALALWAVDLGASAFCPAGALPYAPARAAQVGHAPHPCARWTFAATAICCPLLARSAVDAYAPPP
jgi:hypothetical protein